MFDAIVFAGLGLAAASAAYMLLAAQRVFSFRARIAEPHAGDFRPPVTMLKPLCGLEVDLADNLRSFCRQDYGDWQLVFGVADADDPAIAAVGALQAEFPDRDIALVVDPRIIGVNHKVSNLANMMAAAKHDILIVSDSDMRVRPDYLRKVAAPFRSGQVGAVTCLYTGVPRGGIASRLGAMFINDWFLPSSLIPLMAGELAFCFGATMAVRRGVLDRFGGFEALADHIADDYMLGHMTAEQGYKIALAPYVVENVVYEPDLRSLFLHELRWARTIRLVQPAGYAMSAITELLPLSLAASALVWGMTGSASLAAAPVAVALALRFVLHSASAWAFAPAGAWAPWLIPVRDLLSLTVRVASFFGRKVHWRRQVLLLPQSAADTPLINRQQGSSLRYEKDAVSQPTDL
jgi:ceramide glucosyltransferase